MEKRFEELTKLFENENTCKELLELSPENAVKVLKEKYKLEFTIDELKDFALGIQMALNENSDDEISEEDLELVSGGKKGSTSYNFGYYAGKTVKAIAAVAAVVGIVSSISW